MIVIADSNITKRALAAALKELMLEQSFAKISVADICERCDMNRKSFYYHFKDKYDLVNWIYDTEFIAVASKSTIDWAFFQDLVDYFYPNRAFYRKALSITGQNSFSDHFRELLIPVITIRLSELFPSNEDRDFQINFFADAIIGAIQRWLMEPQCMEPKVFIDQMNQCLEYISIRFQVKEKKKQEATKAL